MRKLKINIKINPFLGLKNTSKTTSIPIMIESDRINPLTFAFIAKIKMSAKPNITAAIGSQSLLFSVFEKGFICLLFILISLPC
jgi:hypothetical protein